VAAEAGAPPLPLPLPLLDPVAPPLEEPDEEDEVGPGWAVWFGPDGSEGNPSEVPLPHATREAVAAARTRAVGVERIMTGTSAYVPSQRVCPVCRARIIPLFRGISGAHGAALEQPRSTARGSLSPVGQERQRARTRLRTDAKAAIAASSRTAPDGVEPAPPLAEQPWPSPA
jgi:hypothetical protein